MSVIDERLLKRTNENECQYLWRVDSLIRSGDYPNWAAVTQIVNEQLYDDELDYKGESAFRKKVAAAKQFYEAGVFDSFSDDDYIQKLKESKENLELEKLKLRDERTISNRDLRIQARIEQGMDLLADLIKKSSPYEPYDAPLWNRDSDNDLVVCLSDIHMGLVTDSYCGTYSPELARTYMEQYLDQIAVIAERHKAEDCYVAILGDLISGKIHLTTMLENRDDVIAQTQQVAELVSWFLSELSRLFDRV